MATLAAPSRRATARAKTPGDLAAGTNAAFLRVRVGSSISSIGWLSGAIVVIIVSVKAIGLLKEELMDLNPGGLIAWLIVGLVAGWLAGQFMKGGGYGLIGDIIMGVIGAFVGGLLFSFLLPGSSVGLLGSIVVAFIGAVVLILLIRALPGRSPV